MHAEIFLASDDVAVIDPVTGQVGESAWPAVLRLEDGRAERYGGNPAVLLVELDTVAGQESDRTLARVAAVLKGVTRDSDVVARVGPNRLGVLAVEGGAAAAYLAARLKVLLALEGIHPSAVRARSRAGYPDLASAWAAVLADDPVVCPEPPPPRRRGQPRMRNGDFLEGLVSELRLDLELVSGVGRRLERRDRPELVELGHFLLRHAGEVESLASALDLIAGGTGASEPVDPAALLREACDERRVKVAGSIRWASPVPANRGRLRAGFRALLDAVDPPGPASPAPVEVSESGLTLTFSPTGDLLDDTRRTWRLRLARRLLENEGGHLRLRVTPHGPRVHLHFAGAGGGLPTAP